MSKKVESGITNGLYIIKGDELIVARMIEAKGNSAGEGKYILEFFDGSEIRLRLRPSSLRSLIQAMRYYQNDLRKWRILPKDY